MAENHSASTDMVARLARLETQVEGLTQTPTESTGRVQAEKFNERYLEAMGQGCPRVLTPEMTRGLYAGRRWDDGVTPPDTAAVAAARAAEDERSRLRDARSRASYARAWAILKPDKSNPFTTNTRKQPNALISPTIGVLRQDLGRAPLDIHDHHLDRGPNAERKSRTRLRGDRSLSRPRRLTRGLPRRWAPGVGAASGPLGCLTAYRRASSCKSESLCSRRSILPRTSSTGIASNQAL